MLYRSEKQGITVLCILITSLFILPKALKKKESPLFLLPRSPIEDTTVIPAVPPQPSTIELNTADSATLVEIRGIGPYYASKIIRYREQLGGFHSPRQLKDIKFQYLTIDSLLPHFTANATLIRRKDLDSMDFKAVLRHPYLEYEDVALIFNAKRKYGRISIAILKERKILPAYKLKKITPYFK